MKKIISTIFLINLCISLQTYGQSVGIGTNNPDTSAMLHVSSSSKGFLMPRMKGIVRSSMTDPAIGLMVYQTSTEVSPPSSPGLYYFDSSGPLGAWERLAKASELTGLGNASWSISGNNQYSSVSGNVGIGSATPNSKLHVAGNTLIDGGNLTIDDPFGTIFFKTSNSNKAFVQMRDANFDFKLGTIAFNTTGKIIFETQSVPRMTVLPNGNVGVGISNPVEKLHVGGDLLASGRIDADGVIEGAGLSSLGSFYVNGTSLLQGAVTGNGSASFSGNINSNTSMSINDPSAILSLKSGGDDKGFVQLSGDNLRIGTFSANPSGKVVIRTGGGDHISIDAGGDLVTDAHIRSNRGGQAIRLDGTNPNIGFYQNGTYHGFISQSGANLFVGVNNGKLQLDGTQVAIGSVQSTADAYKLAVDGSIICQELKVELVGNWPDYVFADDYDLKPISQLKSFITENKHLPNVPSAKEVSQSGVHVGEMQKKLLEKVEELTLYIIKQQEQIDVLKEQLQGISSTQNNK
ncbi:MAG TPA: hypothetical protein PLZ32_03515 [Saprospiraceae bacterium]|mgnify:CR=1 FL=1|nr:hypothetical protein [Saprospiraceae bacterium]